MSRSERSVTPVWKPSLIGFSIVLGLSLASPVSAHEDYPWVRDPRYLTASGAHCCSEQHCQPAALGELTPIPGGWKHVPTQSQIMDDKPGIYPTQDRAGRLFRCVMGGKLVCVFEGSGT